YVFSSDVTIDGHIKGDVIAFAHAVRVNGTVDGNIRAMDHEMTISGTVAKNITNFAQVFKIDASGKVGGSLTLFVGVFSDDGSVGRDILVQSGAAAINGRVEGSLRAKGGHGGDLTIGPNAVIEGTTYFEGRKQPEVSKNAKLASPLEYVKEANKETYSLRGSVVWTLVWAAGFVLFGMLLILLLPDFSRDSI